MKLTQKWFTPRILYTKESAKRTRAINRYLYPRTFAPPPKKEKKREEKERGKDKERRKEKEKLQPQFSLMKIVYTVNGDLQRGNWLNVGAEGG